MIYTIADIKRIGKLVSSGKTTDEALGIIDATIENKIPKNNISEMMRVICDYFGVGRDKILEKTRKRNIVVIRDFISYFIKKYTICIDEDIAFYMKMDRASMVHMRKKVEGFLELKDPIYTKHFNEINNLIQERFLV
jgi:chromosomal replication initiator protein